MSFCHIFKVNLHFFIKFVNKCKGYEMSVVIKNAESLFQRFENCVQIWAEKLF